MTKEPLFRSHADLWVLKAWREPLEPTAVTRPQISQARPRVVFPFVRVIGAVSYTGVVGFALKVRYIELGDGGSVEDLP